MMSLHQSQVPEMPPLASTSPRCELCPAKPLVYCPADQAFLCKDCDDRVHSANFIVLRHTRSALCQSCFSETGLRIQGARNRMQCFDVAQSTSSENLQSLPAMVPVTPPPEAPLCTYCSPAISSRALPCSVPQVKMLQSMGLPVPHSHHNIAHQISSSAGKGESCTTAHHSQPTLKRRRNSKPEVDQVPDVVLRLACSDSRTRKAAVPSRMFGEDRQGTGVRSHDRWLSLSVEVSAESASLESGSCTPSSGCVTGLKSLDSCPSDLTLSVKLHAEAPRDTRLPASSVTPMEGHHHSSSSSSVASCSFTSSLYQTIEPRHAPSIPAGSSCSKPRVASGPKRKVIEEIRPKLEDGAAAPVPLGRPASSRLRRVLKSWSVSLGGINTSTQNLAYELFQRSLLKMKRGEVAANSLRLTLASCLWMATKLVELRAQVPGAKEVASVTAVDSKDLKNAEIAVLKLLDWQPLKHVTERVKVEALAHKEMEVQK